MEKDLESLIEKCLAGEADETEQAELQSYISSSDEAMQEYLDHIDFLLDLRGGVLRQAEKPAKLPKSRRHTRLQKKTSPAASKTPLRWVALITASAAAILLGIILLRPGPAQPEFLVDKLPDDAEILRQGQVVQDQKLLSGDLQARLSRPWGGVNPFTPPHAFHPAQASLKTCSSHVPALS